MNDLLRSYSPLLVPMIIATLVGAGKWTVLDKAARLFLLMMALTLAADCSSIIAVLKVNSNAEVYHFFSIVQLTVMSFYFFGLRGISSGRFKILVAVACTLICSLNLALQRLQETNSNILLLQSLYFSILSMTSLFAMMKKEANEPLKGQIHFWLCSISLVYWSSQFSYWGFYPLIDGYPQKGLIMESHYYVTVLGYMSYAAVFIFLPKRVHQTATA